VSRHTFYTFLVCALGVQPLYSDASISGCPQSAVKNEAYQDSQALIQKQFKQFANDPLVASEADLVMSKLMAAKSVVIIDWLNEHGLNQKSEEDLVKEWREYYAKLFIIQRYPQTDVKLNNKIESLIEKSYTASISDAKRKHLLEVFKKAQAEAVKTVQSFQISKDAQEKIISKLNAVDLVFLKKLKGSPFEKHPLEALWWGIAYDPAPGKINVGVEALQYTDDQTLFAVFAHEMGHVFDSCRWGAQFLGVFPFASVVSCLRSTTSVGAKTRDDSQLEASVKTGKVGSELYASLKANPTCNKLEYPPVGVQADQSLESFADWFSAEVLSHSTEYARLPLRSDLCQDSELHKGSAYPSNSDRLTKIYFANPKLKALVGEQASASAYCIPPTQKP